MSSPVVKGEVAMPADIEGGEVRVRLDGLYLAEALQACGGMVDFKLTDGKSPVLFVVDGYQLVVMPMLTADSKAEAEAEPEDTEQAEPEPATEPEAEAVTDGEAEAEPATEPEPTERKPKRSRKREKVAVA
jgi:hypothetical protein